MISSIITQSLEHVPARLSVILAENGYNTDAGLRVLPLNTKTRPYYTENVDETSEFPFIRWTLQTATPSQDEQGYAQDCNVISTRVDFSVYGYAVGDVLPLMDDILHAMTLGALVPGTGGLTPTAISVNVEAESLTDYVRIDYSFTADSQEFGHQET